MNAINEQRWSVRPLLVATISSNLDTLSRKQPSRTLPMPQKRPRLTFPKQLLPRAPESGVESGAETGLLIGVDGGASKTAAVALDLETGQRWMVKGGPSNPRLTGEKAAVAELIHLIEGVLDIAERAPTDVRSVVLALAGVETEADAARFGVAYHATDETFQRCTLIVNDAVAAWAAATECQPGIGLIAGTGSHAFGVGPSGQYASCGGWGHFLGDEGSGYWMGREALRHLTRSVDGRASSVSLVDAILRRLDVRSVEELLASTRESEPPKREVAALAPEVIGLARDGDPTCLTIVSQAALFLAELVASVVAHAEIDLTTYPVGVVGGLTDGRDVLFPDLESNLSELVGVQVNLQLAPLEPCDGAVALAAQAVDSAPRALAQLRSNAMTPA